MKKLDFDTLTLGEISVIEDLSGYGIGALDEEKPQGKFLAALVMIAKRRDGQPTFTFNAAMATPFTEAQAYLGLDTEDEADPTAEPVELHQDFDGVETNDGDASAEGNGETFGQPVNG